MTPRELWIDGCASWFGETAVDRPTPSLLAPNERRRAPDSVAIALDVARRAVDAAGLDPTGVPSVFASAHGDLKIVDALCSTLAGDPLMLSPTRFHHSVHNAASGYWAIATGCRAASTAIAAFDHSFAAGFVEAACLAATEAKPVLLVGVDTAATGPLASVNTSRGYVGVAWVLTPQPGARSLARLRWSVEPAGAMTPAPASPALSVRYGACARNAMADALAAQIWLDSLGPAAAPQDRHTHLPLGGAVVLALSWQSLENARITPA